MNRQYIIEAFVVGAFMCAGLVVLGYFLFSGIIAVKAMERTVVVKGLAEREVPADVAIWPIRFNEVDNDLNSLFTAIQKHNAIVKGFLREKGFSEDEISVSVPAITDRLAQGYVDSTKVKYRYSGSSTITVYSDKVENVRKSMKNLLELGKRGIAISGQNCNAKTEFLFTKLNDLKPAMIEEATRNAREVAERFARDSKSTLGKIKRARQGQFSIKDRDSSTPFIKKIRVVSTLEYYLSD
ncbi:MAG TPA: SIMPL domain-containing protein [Thermodesulfobacteriaceae bacterium]|nr:SIMPL domain-containing protein [Thermodesulfobacteriaceae bacterium]